MTASRMLVVAAMLSLISGEGWAKKIATHGALTAHIDDAAPCSKSLAIRIEVPENSIFSGREGREKLEKLLAVVRAGLTFECPEAERLVLTGYVQEKELFHGVVSADDGWVLHDSPVAEAGKSPAGPQVGSRVQPSSGSALEGSATGAIAGLREPPSHPLDLIHPAVMYGSGMGELLAESIAEWPQLGRSPEKFRQKMFLARKQFWATYPSQSGRAEAEFNFSRLLEQKDLYYLAEIFQIWGKNDNHMDVSLGKKIDGGIPEEAVQAFQLWASAVWDVAKKTAKPGEDISRSQSVVLGAMQSPYVSDFYWDYKVRRDLIEFEAVRRDPEWASTPKGSVVYLIMRGEKKTPLELEEIYRALADVLGEEAVIDTARKLRAAYKPDGTLDYKALKIKVYESGSLKNHPHGGQYRVANEESVPSGFVWYGGGTIVDVFKTLLAAGEGARYIMGLRVLAISEQKQRGEQSYWDWKDARVFYNQVVQAYGEKTVLDVADKVRFAVKRLDNGKIKDPSEFGMKEARNPYEILYDRLAMQDPAGYVRLMVAFYQYEQQYRSCMNHAEGELSRLGDRPHHVKVKRRSLNAEQCSRERAVFSMPRQSMEAEYVALSKNYGEDRVVRAASALRMARENLHLLSVACDSFMRYQFSREGAGYLLLQELLMPRSEEKTLHRVWEDPEYVAWAKYLPGATVTLRTKGYVNGNEDVILTLESVDSEKVVLSRTVRSIPDKMPDRYRMRLIGDDRFSSWIKGATGWDAMGLLQISSSGRQVVGSQVFYIDGKAIEAKEYSWREGGSSRESKHVWISEVVPGGIVKMTEKGNKEFTVSSFSATPAPGVPPGGDQLEAALALGRLTCQQ